MLFISVTDYDFEFAFAQLLEFMEKVFNICKKSHMMEQYYCYNRERYSSKVKKLVTLTFFYIQFLTCINNDQINYNWFEQFFDFFVFRRISNIFFQNLKKKNHLFFFFLNYSRKSKFVHKIILVNSFKSKF